MEWQRGCRHAYEADELTQGIDEIAAAIEAYRKKAMFVHRISDQLVEIQDFRAKAYMTCRAAIAAKDDFDMAPENKRPGTTEERRRNRDFFYVEATGGMD